MSMTAKTIFGIDLGTTYSCIARVDEFGQPVVLANTEGASTTPSAVFFESQTNVVVGATAKDAMKLEPDKVAVLFKRDMGNEDWRFAVDDKEYRPQELSKFVLQKLAADAEVACGVKVEEVVITCPAYFGVAQKEATRQAGELAGLTVRAVIPEPTAAAVAYGLRTGKAETVLIYDLGGGTFDITLIEIGPSTLTVLATGGDARLGGGDWDATLARYLADQYAEQTGGSADTLTGDPETYARMLLDAEAIKFSLSSREAMTHPAQYATEKKKIPVSRADFDRITAALLESTVRFTKDLLAQAAGTGLPAPTRVCLVGGSSIMPQVKRRMTEEFPDLEIQLEDPNQIVAKGAALYGFNTMVKDEMLQIIEQKTGQKVTDLTQVKAADLEGAAKEVSKVFGLTPAALQSNALKTITNVTSRGFGVRAMDPESGELKVVCLVHVDQPVPADTTQRFGLFEDNQESVDIKIFETEQRTTAATSTVEEAACVRLAEGVLTLDRPYPKGEAIEVTFGLSPDGTLTTKARHPASGRELPLEAKVTGVMSKEEMKEAKAKMNAMVLA